MLTEKAVLAAGPRDKPYKVPDSGGLFLHVSCAGTRTWRFKFRRAGKEKLLVLGRHPDVSLVEDHEGALVKVQDHLAEEARVAVEALRGVRKETFGTGKYLKALQESQGRLATIFEEALLCLRAGACGYQLLCAFPGREAGKRARHEDISQGLAMFSSSGEIVGRMDEALRAKLAGISSYESKALLLSIEDRLFDMLTATGATISDGLAAALRGSVNEEPIAVDLRVDDGRVVAMRLA